MLYRRKIPPTDKNLSDMLLSNGWQKIKEPKNLITTLALSIPFMIFNATITILLVSPVRNWLVDLGSSVLGDGGFAFSIRLIYLPVFFVFLIVHELLHVVLVPNFIKSRKTFWGITPFGGFVSTTEEMSKTRFVLLCVFPFVVLSLIMPIVFSLLGLFSGFIAFLALLNALSSSIDIFNMFLIGIQVPNGSCIINNGFETYHN